MSNSSNITEITLITGDISSNGKIKKFYKLDEHLDGILKKNNKIIENKIQNAKIIFIEEKVFEYENKINNKKNIKGTARIWLIYFENIQMFHYIIRLKMNSKITKEIEEIFYSLLKNIDYNIILAALEKLNININKNNRNFNYDIFSWSFPLNSILIKSNNTIPLDPNNEYWNDINSNKKKVFLETFGKIERKKK